MKKLSSAIALLLLICMLGGCSSPKNAKDPDMQTVADKVGAAIDISELSQVPDAYVENVMGIALDGYAAATPLSPQSAQISTNTAFSSPRTRIRPQR